MRDHPPRETTTSEVPIDLQMARDAAARMTEEQRLALAIEIANAASLPRSRFHLLRLERVARDTAAQMAQADMVQRGLR